MNFLIKLLALFGLICSLGLFYLYTSFGSDIAMINSMSAETKATYADMWSKLKTSGSAPGATVWIEPLAEGVSIEDAEEAMSIVANDANIKAVGILPLSEQVEGQTGEKQRFLKIFQYCDPETAMKMVGYNDAFSAYLPCRIAMVEGKDGQIRLFSLNMDLMIYGGDPLPPELFDEAVRVKAIIQKIMSSGASGDFF